MEEIGDEALVSAYKNGDSAAGERLFERYKAMIKNRASRYYLAGGDYEDLIQEGAIGFLKAVRNYDGEKHQETSFGTFAFLCIERQILRAIEAAGRDKNRILNESIPIHEERDEKFAAGDDPECLILEKEFRKETMARLRGSLSRLELLVFDLYLKGRDYREIARELDKSPKSIDNAIQRIRQKAKKCMC
ncbi:MAG: sigma-70 family RNA polymerase sigma factor [Lachnospiraceae bacterium]|nr:sigma-70 family RNA polymerase sigma factor [Lachnospiraceae bacterium]